MPLCRSTEEFRVRKFCAIITNTGSKVPYFSTFTISVAGRACDITSTTMVTLDILNKYNKSNYDYLNSLHLMFPVTDFLLQ